VPGAARARGEVRGGRDNQIQLLAGLMLWVVLLLLLPLLLLLMVVVVLVLLVGMLLLSQVGMVLLMLLVGVQMLELFLMLLLLLLAQRVFAAPWSLDCLVGRALYPLCELWQGGGHVSQCRTHQWLSRAVKPIRGRGSALHAAIRDAPRGTGRRRRLRRHGARRRNGQTAVAAPHFVASRRCERCR
jgi:hypothetical protein